MRLSASRLVSFAAGVITLAQLSGCGGGSTTAATPAAPPAEAQAAPTTLSGTVAVGAPMTSGSLRILDATGSLVAHDIVINADGTYEAGALTGTGPWRIEACGYTGSNYGCIYSVAQTAGTANVTPLTTAMITLATGQSPDAIMVSGASAPTAVALGAAQAQLQAGLASTLADAGVGSTFDFTTGSLSAGTRSGYDRVLDAVNVTSGTDDGSFVQVTPRLGNGNLYLTTGSTSGTITSATGAAALPLGGLETLFARMTSAIASASTCADGDTGLATLVASDAHISLGDGEVSGGANVAAGLCRFFGSGDDGNTPIWGSRLVSPVLGKCDLTGADPKCAVSFALQDPQGNVEDVGTGMAVVYRGARWQFYGDLLPIAINANAAVQRGMRVDDPTAPLRYQRALQFDIARTDGIACVKLSALDEAQSTIAIYKVFSQDTPRMSLWTRDGVSNRASTDPAVGSLRSADDSWMQLPDDTEGDAVIRMFYRAGRSVNASLFADAACSTPVSVEGKSVYLIDIAGMPPVASALSTLPWGTLSADTVTALEALTLASGTTGSFTGAWNFTDGVTGFDQALLCTSGSCGDGGPARIGDARVRPGSRSAVTPLRAPASDLAAGDYKMFLLGGRDATGMNIQSSFMSCTGSPAGTMCGEGPQVSTPAGTSRRAH